MVVHKDKYGITGPTTGTRTPHTYQRTSTIRVPLRSIACSWRAVTSERDTHMEGPNIRPGAWPVARSASRECDCDYRPVHIT